MFLVQVKSYAEEERNTTDRETSSNKQKGGGDEWISVNRFTINSFKWINLKQDISLTDLIELVDCARFAFIAIWIQLYSIIRG